MVTRVLKPKPFSSPMLDEKLNALCKKLKPILGARADMLWLAFAMAETPQAKREAESLIQMLTAKHLSARVDDQAILLPPPTAEQATGEMLLGTIVYAGKPLYPLYLTRQNFIKHVGIFSITGGGKTNVAQLLMLGLLRHEVPFLVVDWKRSYRTLRTLPIPEVQKLIVYPVGRNTDTPFNWTPLRGPPGVHPKTWIAVVAEALEKSHLAGPGVADIFIELLDKQFEALGVYEGRS